MWKLSFIFLIFMITSHTKAVTSKDLLKNLKSRIHPLPASRGALIQSFDDRNQSYIYDQALAVIAFSNAGMREESKILLRGLKSLQLRDGSFYFSYYLDGTSPYPNEGDRRIAGAISWVALSLLHYQNKFKSDEFISMNIRVLSYLKKQMSHVSLNGAALKGIKFAPGDIKVTSHDETDMIALEHNIDAYSAFHQFDQINHTNLWKRETNDLRNFIFSMWDKRNAHFWSGMSIKKNEIMKSEIYLDNQSWTILAIDDDFLKHISPEKALELNCDEFHVTDKNLLGFMDSRPVNRPSIHSFIWSEGTLGQVMAMKKVEKQLGKEFDCANNKTSDYLSSIEKMQASDGGIAYATSNNNPDFSTASSVAGTSWLYFAINDINPFQINIPAL